MPRREKRVGVMYIDNDKEREVTFFKRRGGLFKGAADLSALTGARVAVVLERRNGKIHSFGTPSAKPIVDAFLSGAPPKSPLSNGVTTARIARLQHEVAQLDMENTIAVKRDQLSIQRMKQIQDENPGMVANLIFSKKEDLSLEDLEILFNELSRVKEDIRSRLPPLHHDREANSGGQRVTQNRFPPRVPSFEVLNYTTPIQSSWSHHVPQQQLCSFPLPSPLDQTLTPIVPMHVPRPITNSQQELPPPHDLHLQNHQISCNMVEQPENYTTPNSTNEHSLDATPLSVNYNVDDFFTDDMYGYDEWGYPLSDQACNKVFLGMDPYFVGQPFMGTGGQGNASLASSYSGKNVDIHATYGGPF
ncbi:unnamed protein product [Alopecurus aequalis]